MYCTEMETGDIMYILEAKTHEYVANWVVVSGRLFGQASYRDCHLL